MKFIVKAAFALRVGLCSAIHVGNRVWRGMSEQAIKCCMLAIERACQRLSLIVTVGAPMTNIMLADVVQMCHNFSRVATAGLSKGATAWPGSRSRLQSCR